MTSSGQSDTRSHEGVWRVWLLTEPTCVVEVPEKAGGDVDAVLAYLRENYPMAREVKVWAIYKEPSTVSVKR